MNKVWTNTAKGEDKIIGIGIDKIFKANPKDHQMPQYIRDIENNNIPINVLSIPFSYIKSIYLQEGKKYIQVSFGKESTEHLRINDDAKRKEIFKYFKEKIPNTKYQFEKYTALKAGKKPLIATLVVTLLFAWTLYLAIQIEIGYEYELVGNGRSITAIILILANLGVVKVIFIFGSLLGVSLFSLIKKIRNKPIMHQIFIIR